MSTYYRLHLISYFIAFLITLYRIHEYSFAVEVMMFVGFGYLMTFLKW